LFIVFSPDPRGIGPPCGILQRRSAKRNFTGQAFHGAGKGENTMHQALRETQKIPFKIVDTFIRIPLSGILIKFLSLRSLRLCGEIVFGQE